MATNPLLRYGPPRQINCTLGISGEFPNYTSGSAYTGTVSINGAQGATRVELVPPGTDANGGAYIPLANGDFAAGSTSWSVQTQTTSPGFSFQSGAGRSGNGFLRWQCSGPMGNNDADVVVNTALVRTTERTTTGRFWAKCTAIGATSETVYAQVAVQMQVFADAAGTQLLGSYLLGFLRFFEVLDWRPVVSSCPTEPGQYVRFSIWIGSGVAATLEFDDAEWDARGIPSGPVSPLALPSGFTIDTVTSPDRVRVQWPGIPVAGSPPYALLHFDGSFADDTGISWTSLGTPTTSISQARFGTASGQFSAGSGIRSPFTVNWTQSNVDDSGNWTAEFWLYIPSNITTYQPILHITPSGAGSQQIALRIAGGGAGTNELYFGQSGSSGGPTGYVVPNGQWIHVAIVRNRATTDLYCNGNRVSNQTSGATSMTSGAIWLGRIDPVFGAGGGFAGFIDEFRFVQGTALYTGSTYTIPSAPFSLPSGTSTLPNLGFESGDVNWLKGYGWAITNVAPVDAGSWSAKFTGLGQSSLVHETMAPVTPGTSITASCRVSKGNNRKDFAGGAVLLEWLDANTRPLGFNVGNVVNTGSSAFQTSSVTATAPAGAAFVRIGASGTRDVKGRATDAVAVDGFTWNHTFALGGSGGSGGTVTPVTGPVDLTFRVTDSVGCSAVATRTIGQQTLNVISLNSWDGANGSTTYSDKVAGRTWVILNATTPPTHSTTSAKFGTACLAAAGSQANGVSCEVPILGASQAFCFDFWLRFDSLFSGLRAICGFGIPGAQYAFRIARDFDVSTSDYRIRLATPSGYRTVFNPVAGTYYHIAFTRDSGGTLRMFVDGTQVFSESSTSGGGVAPWQIRLFNSVVGATGSGGDGTSIAGRIDEFRLVYDNPVWTSNFTPPNSPYPNP